MEIKRHSSTESEQPWYTTRLPFLIGVGWLLLFIPTFLDLFQRWIRWSSELAHGIPVMAIFFYLLWTSSPWRRSYGRLDAYHSALAVAALLVFTFLWFVAYAINIQIIEQVLLIPLLASALAVCFGWRTVFRYRFLLLFPIFAIPVWGSLNDLLLNAASVVVGELVRLIEMPALIRGNSIYIPYGHILIADGCSGLRYFVIALTLAYLISYLNNYREKQFIVLLIIAAILGLITNWIRIFVLIIIGYQTEMESSLMADHEMFGWILFGLICLPAVYFAPVVKRPQAAGDGAVYAKVAKTRLAATVVVAAIGPVLATFATFALVSPATDSSEIGDSEQGRQQALPVTVTAPRGGIVTAERLTDKVFLRIDRYHRQDISDKLVPYIPRLYDHQDWQLSSSTVASIKGGEVSSSVLKAKSGRHRVAQFQWFVVGNYNTHSAVIAKLLQIPAVLSGSNEFAIVTLQARCPRSPCEQEFELLKHEADDLLKGGFQEKY